MIALKSLLLRKRDKKKRKKLKQRETLKSQISYTAL